MINNINHGIFFTDHQVYTAELVSLQ